MQCKCMRNGVAHPSLCSDTQKCQRAPTSPAREGFLSVFIFNISPLAGFVYNIPAIHTKSTDVFSYCLEEPQQKLSSLNWHMLLCGINPNKDWYVLFCHFLYSTFQADCDLCGHCQCLSTSVCVSLSVCKLLMRTRKSALTHPYLLGWETAPSTQSVPNCHVKTGGIK